MSKTVNVNLGDKSYNVLIGKGSINKLPDYLKSNFKGAKVIVVTDQNVAPLYGESIVATLKAEKIQASLIILPPGEGTKSISVLSELYER